MENFQKARQKDATSRYGEDLRNHVYAPADYVSSPNTAFYTLSAVPSPIAFLTVLKHRSLVSASFCFYLKLSNVHQKQCVRCCSLYFLCSIPRPPRFYLPLPMRRWSLHSSTPTSNVGFGIMPCMHCSLSANVRSGTRFEFLILMHAHLDIV